MSDLSGGGGDPIKKLVSCARNGGGVNLEILRGLAGQTGNSSRVGKRGCCMAGQMSHALLFGMCFITSCVFGHQSVVLIHENVCFYVYNDNP